VLTLSVRTRVIAEGWKGSNLRIFFSSPSFSPATPRQPPRSARVLPNAPHEYGELPRHCRAGALLPNRLDELQAPVAQGEASLDRGQQHIGRLAKIMSRDGAALLGDAHADIGIGRSVALFGQLEIGPTSRVRLNRSRFSIGAMKASAVIGRTPGTLIKRHKRHATPAMRRWRAEMPATLRAARIFLINRCCGAIAAPPNLRRKGEIFYTFL